MLRMHMGIKRNGGKHEIRAILHYVHANATPEKIQETLNAVRNQLEKTMPASFRAKYLVNREGLVMRIQCANAAAANQLGRRVEDILNHFLKHTKV